MSSKVPLLTHIQHTHQRLFGEAHPRLLHRSFRFVGQQPGVQGHNVQRLQQPVVGTVFQQRHKRSANNNEGGRGERAHSCVQAQSPSLLRTPQALAARASLGLACPAAWPPAPGRGSATSTNEDAATQQSNTGPAAPSNAAPPTRQSRRGEWSSPRDPRCPGHTEATRRNTHTHTRTDTQRQRQRQRQTQTHKTKQ